MPSTTLNKLLLLHDEKVARQETSPVYSNQKMQPYASHAMQAALLELHALGGVHAVTSDFWSAILTSSHHTIRCQSGSQLRLAMVRTLHRAEIFYCSV